MTALQSIAAVTARVLLAAQRVIVISAGFALLSTLPLWAGIHLDDELPSWIRLFRAFHLRMMIVFLAAGVALFWLHFRRQRSNRRATAPDDQITFREVVLLGSASGLVIWVAASSAPWLSMWMEGVEALKSTGMWQLLMSGDPLSGLAAPLAASVLAVPGLQLATAISSMVGSAVVLLSVAANNRHTANALLQCVTVQGVLLIAAYDCNGLAQDLSQRLIEVIGSAPDVEAVAILSWVEDRRTQAELGLRNLFGPFVGYLLLVVIDGALAKQALSFDAPVKSVESDYPGLQESALPETGVLGAPADEWPELQHAAFAIRPATSILASYMPGPKPYGIFALTYDQKEPLLLRTTMTGRGTQIVGSDGSTFIEIRPGSDLGYAFSVFGGNKQQLGNFAREGLLRPGWILTDPAGIHLGHAKPVQMGIRRAQYALEVGGRTTCLFTWRVYALFRHQMEVEFPIRSDTLDRRLGLALGVILESKARFWAHVYNN